MHVIVGAAPFPAGVAAYSASMNSYWSLTDAPLRSTLLLFSGRYFPSRARGCAAPARGGGRARIAAVAALPRRAFREHRKIGVPGQDDGQFADSVPQPPGRRTVPEPVGIESDPGPGPEPQDQVVDRLVRPRVSPGLRPDADEDMVAVDAAVLFVQVVGIEPDQVRPDGTVRPPDLAQAPFAFSRATMPISRS